MIKLAVSRISFDFDGVMSTKKGQALAQSLIDKGETVFIITARDRSQSKDVYRIADILGIDRTRVIFTFHRDKWPFMDQHAIETHYDNNSEQIKKINENTKTKGILFTNN